MSNRKKTAIFIACLCLLLLTLMNFIFCFNCRIQIMCTITMQERRPVYIKERRIILQVSIQTTTSPQVLQSCAWPGLYLNFFTQSYIALCEQNWEQSTRRDRIALIIYDHFSLVWPFAAHIYSLSHLWIILNMLLLFFSRFKNHWSMLICVWQKYNEKSVLNRDRMKHVKM